MIREILKSVTGKDVELLRPETKADVVELVEREKKGEVITGESMADNRDDWTEQDLIDAGVVEPD
jgi:hypothetical protein